MREVTIRIHDIAEDGLPDMDALVGRVAFIFDHEIVSGWPLHRRDEEDGSVLWEADSDIGRHGPFYGVTQWVEFPESL